MKKTFFSRFQRSKGKNKAPERVVATPDDIRKKLENYQRKDGPANFGNAGLYHVNEVDQEDSPKPNRRSRKKDSLPQ